MKEIHAKTPSEKTRRRVMTGTARLLIVDDEKVVRRVVRKMLEPLGFDLTIVPGGEEAIAALRASGPDYFDLVLMDLSMPRMNGIECFRELKERDPSLRGVVITGEAPGDQDRELFEVGFSDILRKPFVVEALSEKISEILGTTSQDN